MENGIAKLIILITVAVLAIAGTIAGYIELERHLKEARDQPVNDSTIVYYQDGLQHEYPMAK